MIARLLSTSGARFLLIGGLAALINWLVRFPLSLLVPYAAAVSLATLIGMVFGFVLYRAYVFPGSDRALHHQIVAFTLVNLVSLAIVTGVATSLVALPPLAALLGSWTEGFAHAAGIAAGAVSNFIGHRLITFSRSDGPKRRRPATPDRLNLAALPGAAKR